jgi:acetyl-CoA carboxylase carboxyl transferase subunit alpha
MMVVGTQKGRGMKENLVHNFGMANPEGYRKALRLFEHANKFNMPILTLIDTPGAYPGIEGEQHAIGHAIALNIREMARMNVPIFSVVMGEASSGGALGIGVANHIYMLEHAQYTVISPEGCASILWRSASFATQAAEALKITAQDLHRLGVIDEIVPEPLGGAHRHATQAISNLKSVLARHLDE